MGNVLELMAIASLLIPKVMLVSVALSFTPYIYLLICLVLETGIIVLVNMPFIGLKVSILPMIFYVNFILKQDFFTEVKGSVLAFMNY